MIKEKSLSTEYCWKVLIADDEFIIREGIRESVDWEQLRLNVVAEAEDGEEALELALKHRVNILLVDLNMPIMDGIELMKHIRKALPDCKIVIITGHDEFTYAQTAIRLQVKDYILKPANPAQLEKVLRQVRNELEEEAIQQQHLQTASRQITKSYPLLRERFCQEWMEGSMTEEEIVEQLAFLQLPVTTPSLLGMIRLRESATPQPLMKESERQLYLFAIENIAAELLSSYPKVIFRDPFGVIVVLLWSFSADGDFHQIESSVRTYLKVPVDIHLAEGENGLTSMPAVYRKCKSTVLKETAISPLVRRAKQYMLEHYGDCTLTLESMAQQLQTSPVYLSRMIKQELDASFNGYLTQIRIRRASQLLNGTDLTIAEIARQVGYETQHYFSTAFKRTTGTSPLQYRKGGAAQDE
ncbi:response regulator [Paenibacillus lentus]|uniref:Response regulator n=1 Tax=Paenibacillus lentus TaxID=1338368 RepID=A0A3Q8S4S9_9BACL|nr:response regulator [Paenibacillus lentus]AZK46725.1 response regulator [Paenibacillus lentus]